MNIVTLISLGVGAAVLFGLTLVLRALGKEAETCPISGPAAKTATLGVLGAFISMGLGVIFLVGAFADRFTLGTLPAGLIGAGVSAVLLGIAFSIATVAIRDTLTNVRREARADEDAKVDRARFLAEAAP